MVFVPLEKLIADIYRIIRISRELIATLGDLKNEEVSCAGKQ